MKTQLAMGKKKLAGGNVQTMAKAAMLMQDSDSGCHVDFLDLNLGCPIDLVCDRGAGSALLNKVSFG